MVIPKPLHTLLIARQPNKLMPILRLRDPLFVTRPVIPLHPATSNNQDIRRPELHALLLRYSLDILHADFVATRHVILNPFLLCPRRIIDEHAATDYTATFRPVVLAVIGDMLWVGNLFMLEPIVIKARLLVAPVSEAIPLGAALRVDVDEVVPCEEAEGFQVFEVVLGFLAREAWFVDVFESPTWILGQLVVWSGQARMRERFE